MAKGQNHPQGVTWAQAVRDVLITSITKGQLPLVIVGLIVLSLIWRMPEPEVGTLVKRLMDGLENFSLVGYLLFLGALIAWYLHSRYQRRVITTEMERLSDERNRLQEKNLGGHLRSSERR